MKAKSVFIVGILILTFVLIPFVTSSITSKTITIIPDKLESELDYYEKINRVYEIGDTSLRTGYSAEFGEMDAFRISLMGGDYYLILLSVNSGAEIIFPGERNVFFEVGESILVDVNQDGTLDLEFRLVSIKDGLATLFVKTFIDEVLTSEGDYFELFDVTVFLAENEISSSQDLEAFIVFENFGEFPSDVEAVYSIFDSTQEEIYRGVDSFVVQTEETVIKNFEFLELDYGEYILRTEIFYGDNQTGESEQSFSIREESFYKKLIWILIVFLSLGVIFLILRYIRKELK